MKHNDHTITSGTKSCIIAITIFLFATANAGAQNFSQILALALDGKTANSVPMNIFPPGKDNHKKIAHVGDQLQSGTKIIVPPNVIVKLQSPGGTQVIRPTKGKPVEYTIEFTAKGESHAVKGFGAQIENTVKKTVGYNYRNTNEKGTTAASKGTVFTFTNLSESANEKASVITSEGSITIIDKVPCTINGEPIKNSRKGGVTTKAVAKTQTAGDAEFISTNSPIDYANLNWAINYIQDEINGGETDPEDIADDLMCLGDLYLEAKQPQQAVASFTKAADYYAGEYGRDDFSAIEARLSIAQAYADANDKTQASEIAGECIQTLEGFLESDVDDYNFAKENDDAEAMEFICDEIKDICDFLGWAYDIIGDQSTSNEYYEKSESDCE